MRYFIVDDNLATVKTLANIVKSKGMGEVTGYSQDPFEALERIQEESVDIVLVDFLMEGMDGITLVEKLRKRDKNLSFVMISKVSDKDMIQRAYKAGIEFYISKPVTLVEVQCVLNNVQEKKKMQGLVGNLRNILGQEEEPVRAPREHGGHDIDLLLSSLGMLREKGTEDIRRIFAIMLREEKKYDRQILERVAAQLKEKEQNMEQRIRRVLRKGLRTAAVMGTEDPENDVFRVYAPYVFDFLTLKEEMGYVKSGSSQSARVSISNFLDGLMLYYKSI